jgi:putative glycosyltransferase
MMLSIVTTMYYSAPYLDAFYRRSCAVAEQLTSDIEFIFVNDGSPDEALQHALSLHRSFKKLWSSQSNDDWSKAFSGGSSLFDRL